MPNIKTATLSGLLVSKKGSEPLMPIHPGLEEAQTPTPILIQSETMSATEDAGTLKLLPGGYYKALTLKVDKDRFTKLKNLGVSRDLRSQALMTEALDLLFDKYQV